jgi:signal transduction histidine kinase
MHRFLLSVVTPTIVSGFFFSVLAGSQAETTALQNLQAVTSSVATASDRKFDIWKTAIERLARTHVMMRAFDLDDLHWMSVRLAEDMGGWVVMTPANDVSYQYFNTLTGSVKPVVTKVQVPEVLDAVARSRVSGKAEISDVFLGPVSRTGVVAATAHATASTGEEMLLTLSFKSESLSESLANFKLPEVMSVYLVDGSKRIVASSRPMKSAIFDDLPEWLGEALTTSVAGVVRGPGMQDADTGEQVFVHQQLAGAPGWHVIVSLPQSEISRSSLLSGLPLLGAMLVLLISALLERRRIAAEAREAELIAVSGHLETERKLRGELQASLEQVQSLEVARRKMLGILGHEMRTPVLSALAAIELSADAANERLAPNLKLASQGLRALQSLVDDILDLTRLDAGEFRLTPAPFDLSDMLEEAANIVQPMAERHGMTIRRKWPAASLQVMGDQKRFRQILVNLLSNAVKYAPGAPVTLSGSWSSVAGGTAQVRLCVIDEGPGIPEEKLCLLFQPFSRLGAPEASNTSSLGLGLSISKRLAEAMGGQLEVSSRPGGTTFCLSMDLPVALQEELPDKTSAVSEGDGFLEGLSILVVEDHALQAALIEATFKGLRARVTLAASGSEALALVQDGRFDVILIDLGLPDMTGVDLVRELRTRRSQATHIAFSANPASMSREESELFDGALAKGIGKRDLVTAVRGILDSSTS